MASPSARGSFTSTITISVAMPEFASANAVDDPTRPAPTTATLYPRAPIRAAFTSAMPNFLLQPELAQGDFRLAL